MGQDPARRSVPPRFADRVRITYQVIRANPLGDLAVKTLIAAWGALVVAVGIVLIPLPGPGWLIVILGLTILAIEFVWARNLLRFTRDKLRAWTRWLGRQPLFVRILFGLAGLVFVGAVAYLTLRFSLGLDAWHYVTTH
ncbi:MAG TPA: TIGR02611 family protein [Candidatus Limnocylindrales bacterium]|nr:TIGR02611 family protein [Candidatus Limnocylindrales bacterium]